MKISIGNDHGGYELAHSVIKYLQENGLEIFYYGAFNRETSVDYPDYAKLVGEDVAIGKSRFGILICKSGAGMCIAANKISKIRAVNCISPEMARLARSHNDANVLCLGSHFVNLKVSQPIIKSFLNTEFDGNRHVKRLKKISDLENN